MTKHTIFNIVLLLLISNLTAQTVCQEQLEINNGISGSSIGQSIFMADCTGFFSSIELNRSDNGPELTAQLVIFTGQTFIGEPRYVQTVTVPAGMGPFTIDFQGGTGTLAFFEESQYAFILAHPDLQLEASSDINSYTDGQLFVEVGFINNDDLWFKLRTSPTLGIDHEDVQQLSLVPNPAQDVIELKGIDIPEAYSIYNVLGVQVMRGVASKNQSINIQQLTSGLYFLRLNDSESLKFIKK